VRLIDDDGEPFSRGVDLHPGAVCSRVESACEMKGNFWIAVMTIGVP